MKLPLLIISFVFLLACKPNNNMGSPENDILLGDWMVSHEEGGGEQIILRPSDYAFPLSRMRDEFIFHKDNVLIYNTLGPADAPLTKKGKWEWMEDGTLKLYVDELNTFYWKVEVLNDDVLQVVQQ